MTPSLLISHSSSVGDAANAGKLERHIINKINIIDIILLVFGSFFIFILSPLQFQGVDVREIDCHDLYLWLLGQNVNLNPMDTYLQY